MSNRKSIFLKYFVIYSAVILISFICLGAVLLLVSSRYFLQEKKDLLDRNTQMIAEDITKMIEDSPTGWRKNAGQSMKDLASRNGIDILLCDKKGNVITSSDTNGKLFGIAVTPELLKRFETQPVYVMSSFDGTYEECHISGMKFFVNGPEYYVISMMPRAAQDDYVWEIMRIFLVSMIVVYIAVVIAVYFIARRLSAPIIEIAEVSREIGKGNFSVKLPEYNIYEMQELSNAFNDMAASLKSYDTMRNSFVANVSHELRTPMTSIGGFVDGMLDGTIPPEQHKHYLKIISSEVSRLTRLVRSMLNLAKIEAGELDLNLTRFSVLDPIVDTLVTFESRLEAKNIDVRGLDIDRMYLYADNDLIHQVMYNLIENAIKFVNVGGYIEFSFSGVGYLTVISIKNSGDGLSEDELPLVFDRFYKTDKSRGLDATGVGLGLNIVKSIIRLHGGKIMVRSVKGEYTEFVFTVPNRKIGK
ncbi:Signal transduction histidine kinase [Ruminococcaceae bacterium FB2012]|nr:Signal transduction histidine kinase [Ruminococcaceae bacterium FB2012]